VSPHRPDTGEGWLSHVSGAVGGAAEKKAKKELIHFSTVTIKKLEVCYQRI
jgi:hypothetical protein